MAQISQHAIDVCDEIRDELIEIFERHEQSLANVLPDQPAAGADVLQNMMIVALVALGDWFIASDSVPDERKLSVMIAAYGNALHFGILRRSVWPKETKQ